MLMLFLNLYLLEFINYQFEITISFHATLFFFLIFPFISYFKDKLLIFLFINYQRNLANYLLGNVIKIYSVCFIDLPESILCTYNT